MIGNRYSLLFLLALLAITMVFNQHLPAQESTSGESADQDLIDLVIGLLGDSDQEMRAVGLEQVRTELPGESATQQLIDVLPKLEIAAQISLIKALGERGDSLARSSLIEIAQDRNRELSIQVVSIESLGLLGNETDVPRLLAWLADENVELNAAASQSLVVLPGNGTSAALGDAMLHGPIPPRLRLMEIVVQRRAVEAIPQLLQLAIVSTPTVRSAAMQALGEIGAAENLPGMLAGVLKASSGAEREAAEKAVMFVCQRTENAEDRATPVIDVMRRLPEADQLNLLSTVGRVGGSEARQVVESRIASAVLREYKLGVRALCNWPDATVGERLLELYQSEPRPDYRKLILSALIRIAPLSDGRTADERLQLLKTVMDLCSNDSQRKQVLRRSSAIRSIETLRYLVPFFDVPGMATAAHQAAIELAHHRSLREPNQAEFEVALDQILAVSQDPILLDRARRYKNGQTWDRQSVLSNHSQTAE